VCDVLLSSQQPLLISALAFEFRIAAGRPPGIPASRFDHAQDVHRLVQRRRQPRRGGVPPEGRLLEPMVKGTGGVAPDIVAAYRRL
jgi:hypothetical protein